MSLILEASLLNPIAALVAQTAQGEAQRKISINSDLVVLPVTVKDRSGNLAAGLERSDFACSMTVWRYFHIGRLAAFALDLIDDDLKAPHAEQIAASLGAVAAGVSPMDEAIVCRFDLLFYPADASTSDTDRLLIDLKNAQVPFHFVTPP